MKKFMIILLFTFELLANCSLDMLVFRESRESALNYKIKGNNKYALIETNLALEYAKQAVDSCKNKISANEMKEVSKYIKSLEVKKKDKVTIAHNKVPISSEKSTLSKYCKLKASVYTSKRLYNHELKVCTSKYSKKNLSSSVLDAMIKNIESPEDIQTKNKKREEELKRLKAKAKPQEKKTIKVKPLTQRTTQSQTFNVHEENCYTIGLAWGVCATRSLYRIKCEEGTNFSIPLRCRGKSRTKKGLQDGIAIQTKLIKDKL